MSRPVARIVFLSMHPAPYRDPVLARVQELTGDALDILTLYPGTTHPEWERPEPTYRHVAMEEASRLGAGMEWHRSVLARLRRGRYDVVVVPGHMPLTSPLAAAYAKVTRARLVYSADTIVTQPMSRGRRAAYRGLVSAVDAVWTPGAAGRSFWTALGMPSQRIFEGMYTLSFDEIERGLRDSESQQDLRRSLDLAGRFVHLFVGHFTPGRRVPDLVRAFTEGAASDDGLLLIGEGEDSAKVRSLIKGHPRRHIRHLPGVSFDDLHAYFGLADSYVHPGAEPYSLALQEAALVGLPIIASEAVGATHDYVVDGVNGIRIEPGDQRALAEALRRVRGIRPPESLVHRARSRGVDFAVGQFLRMVETVTTSRVGGAAGSA